MRESREKESGIEYSPGIEKLQKLEKAFSVSIIEKRCSKVFSKLPVKIKFTFGLAKLKRVLTFAYRLAGADFTG